ncbi:glycoside hydrolase family 65 protein [Chryseobacterium sp.]|uniref:glycosyl hydrolase family 95 catalytic domain-containing protein n=1 Tax=Chryseobacterium sp. TaxID=1871047 RepID=UPI0025BC9503|nr:glycoside hydrolase family 65 protein [Chryseobacterium sp.]MBV8326867.1 glycoside hydrolase family 65 protein [Chryseobacterium sp.]
MKKRLAVTILYTCFFGFCAAQDPWIIRSEKINPNVYTGVTVSNGMIGMISSPEPLKAGNAILAGVYDQYGRGRTSNFLSNFNVLDFNLYIDWKQVNQKNVSNYTQEINFKTAVFSGTFDYGDQASVEYQYVALRHLPNNVMLTVTIHPKKDLTFVAESNLKTPQGFLPSQQNYNEVSPPHATIPLLTSVAKSPTGALTMAASTTFVFPEEQYSQPKVSHEIRDSDAHLMKFVRKLKASETYTFSLIGSMVSSSQVHDPYNTAERLSIYANLQNPEQLYKKHEAEWQNLWKGDIEIEGDPQAQQDVHNMLYHLYSFSREGSDYSLSPVGLSGTGYNGHIFWDTEMFMFKPLVFFHPETAKGLINYRFNRIKAAETNARMHGYKGAMFPWESAVSGEEETPVWALSGTYEHHITGDVAFAAWYYYLMTKDTHWLRDKGWPILSKTAEFWQSRVEKEGKEYHIKNVVAADEWAENVDNNAYTNAIAKQNLKWANAAAGVLNIPFNKKWDEIAENLIFTKLENGVTKEHDTYKGADIKQADVNLLAYPLNVIQDKDQIRKDLQYYQERIPNRKAPAMTKAIFALLYSRLGEGRQAYKWFKESYEPNLLPPFRVLAETEEGDNPYFITGAGGVLQAVMMGFAGIDMDEKGSLKAAKTALPPHWKKVTVKGIGPGNLTFSNSR